MKRFSLTGLPVLLALITFLGFSQTARAEIDPNDPFASLQIQPTAGKITDVSQFNQITFSIPSEGAAAGDFYLSKFNISLNKIYLRVENADGTYSNIGNYKGATAVDADKKTEYTLTLSVDATQKNLAPGKYQIYIQKSGTIQIFGGGLSSAKSNPAGMTWDYTYAPGGSAGVVWTSTPANAGVVSPDDFLGITLAFEDVTKVELMAETYDDITFLCNGNAVTPSLSRDNLTFVYPRGASVEGIWELSLPEGFYKLTLSDGTKIDSPAISTYCYVGEISYTTTPAPGSTVYLQDFTKYKVAFPSDWEVTLGEKDIRKAAYFEVNGEKQMFGTYLFITDNTSWEPTIEEINITELSEAKVYIPAGTYNLTQSGKAFPSPEISYTFNLEPVPPLTVNVTTTPADKSIYKGTLNGFSVSFSSPDSPIATVTDENVISRNIMLTWGDSSINYGFGIEGSGCDFTLLTPIEVTEITEATLTFGEGVYTLTAEDGRIAPSPAFESKFWIAPASYVTVDPENPMTSLAATPEPGTITDASAFNDLTLTCKADNVTFDAIITNNDRLQLQKQEADDTWSMVGYYTYVGLTDDRETLTMHLNEDASTLGLTSGNYRIVFVESNVIYLMDSITKTSYINKAGEAFEYTLAIPSQESEWVPVTDLNLLKNAEVALVWYYDGVRFANLAPEKQNAPVITMGTEECVVMNNGIVGTIRSSEFTSTEIPAEDYTTVPMGVKNKYITSIKSMPKDAAIIKVEWTDQGFTLYDTNAETPGYLCPQTDLNTNVQTIKLSDEPYYNTISIDSKGWAKVNSSYRSDANVLSATTLWSLSGNNECTFKYIHQALDMGHLYLFAKKTPQMMMSLNANPPSGTQIKGTSGTEEITFSIGDFEHATINPDVKPTATLGKSQEVELTYENSYPVKVTVNVPANAQGRLVIQIPAGWLNVDVNGVAEPTPAYSYSMTFLRENKLQVADIDVAVTPANGSTVKGIDIISLSFPESVKEVALNEEVAQEGGIEAIINGEPTTTPVYRDNYTYAYRPQLTTPGEFTFRLAEGFYILTMEDGTEALSPKIETTVNIQPYTSADIKYTTTPAADATVTELKEFSITFQDVAEVSFGEVDFDAMTLSYGETTLKYLTDFEEGEGATDPITTMILKKALSFDTPTVVTVNIAEGFYMLTMADDSIVKSPAIEFSFTISKTTGIEGISTNNDTNDVYTTDGVRILKNATEDDIKTLAPGLYIQGGRVILKK